MTDGYTGMVVHVSPDSLEVAPAAAGPAAVPNSLDQEARAQLSHIKGAFLASLNHEVRTPLSGIIGMLDLLQETQLDEDQRDYLSAARLCTDSLLELLNASLQYSALEAGQFTLDESEFCVREMLDAALAPQKSRAELKRIKLSMTVAPNLPETMVGDAPRLRELLGHLVANAVKFTNAGFVEIRSSVVQGKDGRDRLVMAVHDTGIGIPADELEGIFESFRQRESGFSRSYPGLGLGLALVKKLTAVMGGEIHVESHIGVGSSFTVEIPLRRPAVNHEARESKGGPLILAVEDNPVGMTVLRHILERRKANLECASSGQEAIDLASRHRFDLILMDLQMPGVNGLEAAAAIRKLPGYSKTPILALTASCSDEVREQCREQGMQAFLSKPVDANELWSAISRYVAPR